MTDTVEILIDEAKKVRKRAHAKYSGFYVGAALIDEHGDIYTGCNVENAAYPEGVCAETSAIAAMIAGGGKRISAIAVVGGKEKPGVCTPCGGCRQRILEFADEHTEIILLDPEGAPEVYKISDLLPISFKFD